MDEDLIAWHDVGPMMRKPGKFYCLWFERDGRKYVYTYASKVVADAHLKALDKYGVPCKAFVCKPVWEPYGDR